MAPGARSKFGVTIFEPKVFQTQMCCIEKVLVTLLGFFGAPIVIRRPVNSAPLPPLVTPLLVEPVFREL